MIYGEFIEKLNRRRNNIRESKNSKHKLSACLYRGKNPNNFITTGFNNHIEHAEEHSIKEAIRQGVKGNVNIFVVKTTGQSGKPCSACIGHMVNAKRYGIKVRNITYTVDGSDVITVKLNDLVNDPEQHISRGNRIECDEEDDEDEGKKPFKN